jgi:hypothetical protein
LVKPNTNQVKQEVWRDYHRLATYFIPSWTEKTSEFASQAKATHRPLTSMAYSNSKPIKLRDDGNPDGHVEFGEDGV